MKNIFYLCLVLIVSACLPVQIPITPGGGGNLTIGNKQYHLVWADEFNYSGLPDAAKWRFETGYVRNQEVQYYTDSRLENCKVENGRLYITALNDSFQGHPVTSASIETKGIQTFKYGYIEVRAKMPHLGKGTWPAIWTLGVNHDAVGWPRCGEIDIMEWIGKAPTVVLGSTFLPDSNGNAISRNWPYIVSNSYLLTDVFHNYAIEWDSTQVKYYFDNNNYATYTLSDLGSVSWMPLTKEHYLKLNLAMGGSIPPIGGGGAIDYTKFPYTFEVEYVRYYKRL
ncbi:MAG: glycoside hydrolase family 16 protein [Chitinophagales bacterium]